MRVILSEPVKVVELDVEQDGAEGEAGLEEDGLGIVVVPTQQRHLGVARLLHRDVLDVHNELHFVSLEYTLNTLI